MNDIDIQYELQKINKILEPLNEGKKTLREISSDLNDYFKKYEEIFSKNAYCILWNIVKEAIEKTEEVNKYIAQKNAKIALETLKQVNNSLGNISTTGLGFSLITNSTSHALAYTALNHLETQRQIYEQKKAIYDNALKKLQSLSISSVSSVSVKIKGALEEVLYIIVLLEKYQNIFVENKKFCPSIFKHSHSHLFSAVSEKGKLLSCLEESYEKNEFVIGAWRFKKEELYKLETEGYIRIILDDKWYDFKGNYFVSTGKLELELWQDKYWQEHPNEKEEFDKYVLQNKKTYYEKAEQELSQNLYYEAAVDFAKADDYNDALKRSIAIWNEYLLDLDIPNTFPVKIKNFILQDCKCKKFKKIITEGTYDAKAVALGEDGRIYSSSEALESYSIDEFVKYKEWTDIVDFWTDFSNIVGIKKDGTVVAEGFKLDRCVIGGKKFIRAFNKCALTDTGDIIFLVSPSEYLSEEEEWLKSACSKLHGVVNVFEVIYYERGYLYALTAEGNLHPLGFDDNILCLENIVSISRKKCYIPHILTFVTTDGKAIEYNVENHNTKILLEGLFQNVNKLPLISTYTTKDYRKKEKKLKANFKGSIKRK